MVSSAQISYPVKDGQKDEPPASTEAELCEDEMTAESDPEEEMQDDSSEEEGEEFVEEGEEPEGEACGPTSGQSVKSGYIERESGRSFDISPEDFCADPYEQYGNLESRQALGKKGEDAAVRYLNAKGYEILKRNWFCRFGEADIIARDVDGTLCFIEVKTRKSIEAGLPEEAITKDKQRRYERIALAYMMVSNDWDDNDPVRFDAICICVTGPHRAMLRHHKGCFDACF